MFRLAPAHQVCMDTANEIRSKAVIGSHPIFRKGRIKLISNHSITGKAKASSVIYERVHIATSPHTSFGRLTLVSMLKILPHLSCVEPHMLVIQSSDWSLSRSFQAVSTCIGSLGRLKRRDMSKVPTIQSQTESD